MRTWVSTLALLVVTTAAPGVTLTRGPYLQLGSHDSILVVWQTQEAADSAVDFGLDAGYGSSASDAAPVTHHAVALTGLSSRTKYFYRILSGGEALAEGKSFTTAPAPGSPDAFSFIAFGDSGGGTQPQIDVAARMAATKKGFGIHIGDIAYTDDVAGDLNRLYFDIYRDIVAAVPIYIALGNKDVDTDGGAAVLAAYHLPENGGGPERFYSFVHGNALFVALDTNRGLAAGDEQAAWLEGALAAEARWKIIFFHHPIRGSARGEPPHRAALEPLFARHRVDLVFQGHTHFYERTFPIVDGTAAGADGEPDYADPQGPIYIVTGGGGGTLASAAPGAYTVKYQSVYHFVAVDVDGAKLSLRAIGRDGAVIDAMTITKTVEPPPPPRFRRGDADANAVLELTDGVRVLGFLFLGTPAPECLEAADADDNGEVEITDAVRILSFLFLGGEPPPAPGPPPAACGPDPAGSPDSGCDAYAACG